MTQEDNVEKKVQQYISEIKNGYNEASYLTQIMKPLYSSVTDDNMLQVETREIPLARRNLMDSSHDYRGLENEGRNLATKEILLLISKMEEVFSPQELDDLSPISFAQYLLPNNRRYFILVPRNIFAIIRMKNEWLIEDSQEKNWPETRLGSPPAPIIVLPKPITNKIFIIDQPYSVAKYYSSDKTPENRFDIQRVEDGFTIKLLGSVLLHIDVHSIGDTSILTFSDESLKS